VFERCLLCRNFAAAAISAALSWFGRLLIFSVGIFPEVFLFAA
jgi:hypothetical protein